MPFPYSLQNRMPRVRVLLPLPVKVPESSNSGTFSMLFRRSDFGRTAGDASKKHDYVTGKNEVGSASDNVESDLSDLLEEVNTIGKKSPLKAGAYFHARFENIHPFADGNGRVGRTLLNYWLMVNDYPPMIIYEEDKRNYYEALQAYDEQEIIAPLVAFFEEETSKTWTRTMGLTQEPEQKRRQGLQFFML